MIIHGTIGILCVAPLPNKHGKNGQNQKHPIFLTGGEYFMSQMPLEIFNPVKTKKTPEGVLGRIHICAALDYFAVSLNVGLRFRQSAADGLAYLAPVFRDEFAGYGCFLDEVIAFNSSLVPSTGNPRFP